MECGAATAMAETQSPEINPLGPLVFTRLDEFPIKRAGDDDPGWALRGGADSEGETSLCGGP